MLQRPGTALVPIELPTDLPTAALRIILTAAVVATSSFGGNSLLTTNLTGHPAVVLPNGFNPDGTPVSLAFPGRLFGEADVLALAEAYQGATEFQTRRPPKFG